MKNLKHIRRFNESEENLNSELSKETSSISDVSESKKLSEDEKKKLYLEVLGKSIEFTKKAGECLGYTKSEIKKTNINEIYPKLKSKKKELEDLISEFEKISEDAKKAR